VRKFAQFLLYVKFMFLRFIKILGIPKLAYLITSSILLDLLKGKSIMILALRGGLGNQLYQLSALAFYCKRFSLKPYVFDFELKMDKRDNFTLQYKNLNIKSWFQDANSSSFSALRGLDEYLFRFILKMNRSFRIFNLLSEKDLEHVTTIKKKVVIIRDSFQNMKYPLSLPTEFHLDFFPLQSTIQSFDSFGIVGVHIRLLDFLPDNPFDHSYYNQALKRCMGLGSKTFCMFSDDIPHAKELAVFDFTSELIWPEEKTPMNSIAFLSHFSSYNTIIASKSSLCWWASFLAWKRNPNLNLIHPWGEVESFKDSI